MPTTTDQADALLAVADKAERRLAAAVRRTMNGLQAAFPEAEVAKLIEAHRGISVDMIPWNDFYVMPTFKSDAALVGDNLQAEFLRTMVEAAKVAGVEGSSFTVLNPYAIRAARTMAADLVAHEKRVTREAVKRVIVSAVRGRLTAQEAARLIARSVGLDPRSAQALANYAVQLAAVDAGTAGVSTLNRAGMAAPKTARGRATAVDRYAKRLLRTRAETIARTEIMTAANRGVHLSWEQAARDELINTQHARRQIVVTYDDRTCPRCSPLDGAVVGFGESFVEEFKGAKTTFLFPPIHQKCRCTVILLT